MSLSPFILVNHSYAEKFPINQSAFFNHRLRVRFIVENGQILNK